jgi:TP901 family phage tail tape measure protein
MALPKTGVELVAAGLSDFLGDMRKASRAIDDFTDGIGKSARGMTGFGEMMTGSLRRMGELGTDALMEAGRATAAFVGDSLSAAGDVEQTLNVLQVAGKATDDQMAEVSKRALALGSDLTLPATSAADASTAMLELVKSGFSVQQAMDGAKGTLQLAAAAETDAATAAQVMSGALNAFGLDASHAVEITDLLAGAANASQASISDLSMGFNQAGFMFKATGQSADDLAVSLAVLTKNGLTGSDAGTALKNAMTRLIDPTDEASGVMASIGFNAYTAQGVMKPWPQIIEELRKATAGMTEEQRNAALSTIFLSDGFKAMQPLLGMSQAELQKMYTEVTASGQAAELSGAQMKGWNGAMAGLQSQIETLQLVIGQHLLPILTPMINQLGVAAGMLTAGDYAGFFREIGSVAEQAVDQVTTFFRQLGEGTSPISPFIDSMVRGLQPLGQMLVDKLGDVLEANKPAIASAFGEMGKMAIMGLISGIGGTIHFFGVALGKWILETEPHIAKALELWSAQFAGWVNNGLAQMLEDLSNVWTTVSNWFGETAGRIGHEALKMGEALIQGFGNAIMGGIGWVRDQAWNMANAAREAAMQALGIGSPSKVFAEIGAFTAEGMMLGLAKGTPAVQATMAQMASPIAYPGGGGSTTTIDSRSFHYNPEYGQAVQPSPQRDSIVARSMALW